MKLLETTLLSYRDGYAPLYSTFESFYIRNVYRRIGECFNNVIGSVPGATVTFIDRKTEDDCWTFQVLDDARTDCINVSRCANHFILHSLGCPSISSSLLQLNDFNLSPPIYLIACAIPSANHIPWNNAFWPGLTPFGQS